MRIYFVGSHATGKTTLCRWVSRRYGLPMISEVARGVLAEMECSFDALRADIDAVGGYQRRVYERQIAAERVHAGGFVSDRAFDNLAYAAEHTTILADLIADPSFGDYMDFVARGLVFFLRPHPSLLKEDGVRAGVTWESVVRIDGMVKLLLEQYRIRYLPVESVSMQERVRTVEFVVGREVQTGKTSAPERQGSGQTDLHRPFRVRSVEPEIEARVENQISGNGVRQPDAGADASHAAALALGAR